MILAIVYYLLIIPLILFLTLFLLIFSLSLCAKLKLEPVRGVCTSNVRLDGKIALVTGGNQGIGLETARDLASRGAQVIIACRDATKAAEAIADIAATTGNRHVEFKPLDLSKFCSVREFAEDFNKSYDRLDILVNNAGCGGLIPKLTEDRIDVVMQVNYFGPFVLTNLLLDKLITSKPSRIIIVSSAAHNLARLRVDDLHQSHGEGAWGMVINYANSKLCDLLWTKALAKRLPEEVTVNSLHPGIIKTDIFRRMPAVVKKMMYFVFDILFRGPKGGAQTTIHLCVSDEVKNVRGRYFMECKEGEYSRMADDDELVEHVWKRSLELTSKSYQTNGNIF